jgi:AAR2 protein
VQDRTEQAMDTSSHIKAIISGICTYEDSDEIIGEIQFCYLTGMLIGNAACMEHWVRALISGLTRYSHFFMRTKNRSRVSELSSPQKFWAQR